MLPRADLIGAQPLKSVDASIPSVRIGEARQEAFQRSLQTLLGKQLQGEVLARLNDGSFVVKLAGASARMMLPTGIQVGMQVPLTLIAISPRPTFQISTGGSVAAALSSASNPQTAATLSSASNPQTAAPLSSASNPQTAAPLLSTGANPQTAARLNTGATAQMAPALLDSKASQLSGFNSAAPATTLSDAARVISTVLAAARSVPNPPQAIIGKTPLMAGPTVLPEQLAQQLQAAVGNSGLFYESHVAEWADGKRTLPELMREPQMQKVLQAGSNAGLPGSPDLASAQLINLQLQTQEQARVQWQGEAWPGQRMQWDIHKDAPEHDDDDAAPQATWRSAVRFQFPLLGAVEASLVLVGGQVHIQLRTGSEQSAVALRAYAGALEQSLGAAGSVLSSLTISQREAASDVG